MEKFKEEIFIAKHNGPIKYLKVLESDISIINKSLDNLTNGKASSATFTLINNHLTKELKNQSLETKVGLIKALSWLGLIQESKVFLIWQLPDTIDKLKVQYLSDHWEDIWFAPSDDAVVLFFPNANKWLLVTHFDIVYYH